jgi:hypothetical protein
MAFEIECKVNGIYNNEKISKIITAQAQEFDDAIVEAKWQFERFGFVCTSIELIKIKII